MPPCKIISVEEKSHFWKFYYKVLTSGKGGQSPSTISVAPSITFGDK